MDYRKALLDVYKNQYANGICPNIGSCSANMPVCGHRYSVARLGYNYGNTEKPKLLFVGKEGTDSPGRIDPSFIKEPASLVDDVRSDNWHYFGTIYTAAAFLFIIQTTQIKLTKMRYYNSTICDMIFVLQTTLSALSKKKKTKKNITMWEQIHKCVKTV